MSYSIHPVPDDFAAASRLRKDDYHDLYARSVADPSAFWGIVGQRLDWSRPYHQVRDVSFDAADFRIR